MKSLELERQEHNLRVKLEQQQRHKRRHQDEGSSSKHVSDSLSKMAIVSQERPKSRRWDMPTPDGSASETDEQLGKPTKKTSAPSTSQWEGGEQSAPRLRSRWDATPVGPAALGNATPVRHDQTPGKSRWDATPSSSFAFATTPLAFFPTNISAAAAGTPASDASGEWWRNKPLTDEELDAMLPSEGYAILAPPSNYVPIMTPSRKLTSTPMAGDGLLLFEQNAISPAPAPAMTVRVGQDEIALGKSEDLQFFGKLLNGPPDTKDMSLDEVKERKIMQLLLKVKNGTPPMRRFALKQLVEKARDFGAAPLFDQILPLLMSPTLEDQERHLLVKLVDRILYRLDDLVRPYVHKILVVIEPLLIDEDYYVRLEGREIISNLSKAAGLAAMVAALRPDIDHVDEYVRNTTARAFAVVASALGIPALLPFLRAVCASRKSSWMARHTGIKIVQQTAQLLGCAILPHLPSLVSAIAVGLTDEQLKVRIITALALAALAEASCPHGFEAFQPVLRALASSIRSHRGKALAAFLKAMGQLVPLLTEPQATKELVEELLLPYLLKEFQSSDEEMRRIVLAVVKQLANNPLVSRSLLRNELLPDFHRSFWQRRVALDRRTYRLVVETTVSLAAKTGLSHVLPRLVGHLKDDSEPFRRMTLETIDRILAASASSSSGDIEKRDEEQLVDGLLYAFQEQVVEENSSTVLRAFERVATVLGARMKPYLMQMVSMALWRLTNRSACIRQLAAELVGRMAAVMVVAGEEALLGKLSMVLYENLGEEYPDVLASILGALKAIVAVVGMSKMTPPINELLPRLTPILRNRHERVQENCIDLVGRIADRAAEAVSAREWMRVCFELIDMLKAHRKSVRRAAVNTFGYIAKAIGPQDVLATLLNNLKVQERQNRLCTTIAIAIVAETCGPFTVLPALMNEYRVPELNVQNGVLKALSFLFEYIGETGKDYIYAVTPLLTDALTDRDAVHRQLAAVTIKHMALGAVGHGCEEAFLHLLNHLLPNIFERSPHVIMAVVEALDALSHVVGAAVMLQYLVQGLFHPARKVRFIYWKAYNNLYIRHQEALTAFYPRLKSSSLSSLDASADFMECHIHSVVL